MRKIGNRNLIVTETFDEFARATEDMDFSVEDLVAYVTSLANVFYWLNVESIWGRLGFVWDHLDDNKGYGHFVHTTIPFTVIPSLPDGERITQLRNNFISSIGSSNVEILKSNWENLERIEGLAGGKTVIANLTGAPLTSMHNDIPENPRYSLTRMSATKSGTLYLKADFSQCGANGNMTCFYLVGSGGTFIIDDDNKYLNIPSKSNYTGNVTGNSGAAGTLHWKGEGPFKIEYIWRDYGIDSDELNLEKVTESGGTIQFRNFQSDYSPSSNYYLLVADSKEYVVPATVTYGEEEGINYYYYHPFIIKLSSSPIKVTVDCTMSSTIILTKLLQITRRYSYTYVNALYPVEFIGNLTAVDVYNPYVYIEDEWPEYNASVVSKVIDTDFSALIYQPYLSKSYLPKCPYTFDVSNRDYVRFDITNAQQYISGMNTCIREDCNRVYKGVGKYFKVDSQYKDIKIYSPNILTYSPCPNIVGNHRFKMLEISCMGILDYTFENYSFTFWGYPMEKSGKAGASWTYYIQAGWTLPVSNLEADNLNLYGAYITDNDTIKANRLYSTCYRESSAVRNIYMYKTNERPYYRIDYIGYSCFFNYTDIDFIEYEDLSDEVLNASYIDTSTLYPNEGYSYLMPYIITHGGLTINMRDADETAKLNNRTFNPSLIFIRSGVNLEFTFKGTCDYYSIANIKRLIHGIKKVGTNTSVGTITLISTIYDALVADDTNFESYVINTLGYTLIRREYSDV